MDTAQVCRTCLRSVPAPANDDASVARAHNNADPFLLPLGRTYISVSGGEEVWPTRVSYLDCLRQCTQMEVPVMAVYANGDFKYPMNICVRCAKALQVAYHFTKLAQESENKLQRLEAEATESHLKLSQEAVELEQLDGCHEHNSDMLEDVESMLHSQVKTEAVATSTTLTVDEPIRCSIRRLEHATASSPKRLKETAAEDVLLEAKGNNVEEEMSMSEINSNCEVKDECAWNADMPTEIDEMVEYDEEATPTPTSIETPADAAEQSKRETLNLVRNKAKILEDTRELQKAIADNEVQLDENELVCVQCNSRFSDISVFIRHINHHKGITPFRCNSCNFFTCYSESLRKHYKREHNIEATNDMLDMPINPYMAPMEKPYQEVIYTCKDCDYNTHEEGDIKVHIMNEHLITKDLDEHLVKAYNCPDCHRQFKDRKAMHAHFTLMHGTSMGVHKISREVYTCEFCDKQFQFKNSLAAHQRVCRLREDVNCHICGKKCSTLRKFELHLRHEHAVETIHECEVCGKSFKNPEALSLHRKRHTERHHHCSICPRSYVNSSELKVHMERVHSNEPKEMCSVCGVTFPHIGLLRQHENKEHYQTVYKCCHCEFQSTSGRSVRMHEFVHTGKPYKCETCGREFAQRVNLRHHARNAHSIELSEEQLGAMFRQRFGYFSRYDAFSKCNNSLEITEVTEADIEKELEEIGLNVDDVMKELFNTDIVDELTQ